MTSLLKRHQPVLAYGAMTLTSLYAGLLVARNQEAIAMSMVALLALSGLIVLVAMPVGTLFAGWLFVGPLLQAQGADHSSVGRGLTWAVYIAPALLFAALTALRRRRVVAFIALDWLPAAYVVYVVASMLLLGAGLQGGALGTGKSIVVLTAMGPIVYYFLTFGPGIDIPLRTITAALMAAGVLQGGMAVLDMTTSWNLWNDTPWRQVEGGSRAVGTLANPAVLGMFLGVALALAVAILAWGGPRSLRPLAWVTVVAASVGVPLTLTRGAILGAAVAAVGLLVLGRTRFVALGVLAATALAAIALFPSLQETSLYQQRLSKASTVQIRVVLRDVSFDLAAQKPVLGWGHGRFDEVKNAVTFTAEGVPIKTFLGTTSHDTFLTKLVELGAVGLALYALPFLVLSLRALRRRVVTHERWLVAGALASLLSILVTASTLDLRFFSFAQMLPFLFLAMLRRLTADTGQTPSPQR